MLYLIRHGETDWNKIHRLQGRTDIPLNQEGIRMAKEAAKEYSNIHFDKCYCSPLIRARKTAEILLEGRNIPIIIDDRLMEMNFGIREGITNHRDNIDRDINLLFNHPELYKGVEAGESLEDLFERTGGFLREVVEPELEQGLDILIVAHGAANSSIICLKKNIDKKDFWSAGIENCKLKIVE